MKKFFSKIILCLSILVSFGGASTINSLEVRADTRSVSFVIDKSLTNGNPILNSRIVIGDAYDNDQKTTGQNVPYQSARSFRVQTGRHYIVSVEGRYQVAGFLPRSFNRRGISVYVPHGARVVYIK